MDEDKEAGLVLTNSVKNKLRDLFTNIDSDGSGNISVQEFKEACSKLSLKVTQEEIGQFIKADESGDNCLDFEEFCHFYIHSLKKVFTAIDTDYSGHISIEELKMAFDKLGQLCTDRELKLLLSQVDKDSSGTVDFNEFCEYFISLPSPSMRAIMEQWATGLSIDVGTDLAPPHIPPPSLKIWQTLFAGGVAGVVSRTATAPLEKIKLLAQTRNGRVQLLPTIRNILKGETWRGLFAGNGLNCLRILPFSGLVCLAYANIAQYFPLDSPTASPLSNSLWRMGAGATAGSFATILTHPIDVVRAQVTVSSHHNTTSLRNALIKIYQQDKLRGLYRGLTPTLLAIAPFMAVQQSSYDILKYQASMHGLQPSPLLFLTCGSIAGATAQTVVYPLDVIRRRLQVSGKDALRNMSFRHLFGGLFVTYLKIMPSAAISLLIRDALLGRLK